MLSAIINPVKCVNLEETAQYLVLYGIADLQVGCG